MRLLVVAFLSACLGGVGCAGRKSEAARQVDMRESAASPASAPSASTGDLSPVAAPKQDQRPPRTGQNPVVVVPSRLLTGKILRADKTARFVVVVFPLGQMPAVDQRLSVYREGRKVGEIKISGPQRDDKTVGDIVAGDAEPGDQVSER